MSKKTKGKIYKKICDAYMIANYIWTFRRKTDQENLLLEYPIIIFSYVEYQIFIY